jgi:hypothetical protein
MIKVLVLMLLAAVIAVVVAEGRGPPKRGLYDAGGAYDFGNDKDSVGGVRRHHGVKKYGERDWARMQLEQQAIKGKTTPEILARTERELRAYKHKGGKGSVKKLMKLGMGL